MHLTRLTQALPAMRQGDGPDLQAPQPVMIRRPHVSGRPTAEQLSKEAAK